jgi:hypothetical protein
MQYKRGRSHSERYFVYVFRVHSRKQFVKSVKKKKPWNHAEGGEAVTSRTMHPLNYLFNYTPVKIIVYI